MLQSLLIPENYQGQIKTLNNVSALLQKKNDDCCAVGAVRRSLAGTETKLPQIRLSSTGNRSTSCRHGSYFVCFDDGEDAALLSGIVIANHLDGLISDDKNILHPQLVDCVHCQKVPH